MIKLLRLCGYEERDIKSALPRFEEAFKRLGIDNEDIDICKDRLNSYYDMDFRSVSKGIGLCLKNVVDTVLAREEGKKKIIYSFMSPGFDVIGTALMTKSEDIFSANLNCSMQFVLGCLFNKMAPVLEASEKMWLKAGKAHHCGNVKSSLGFLILGMLPKPDLLVTAGLLCDTAPKSTDIFQELFGVPVYTYNGCVDLEYSEYPDFRRTLEFASKSARHLAKKIGELVGVEITDSMLMKTLKARSAMAGPIREMKQIMETSDPLPISVTHDFIWHCVMNLSVGIDHFKEPIEVIELAASELKTRVKNEAGVTEKGAPRVLALIPNHCSDPRWEHYPYEYGISLISCEDGFFPPNGERCPNIEGNLINDPYISMVTVLQSSLNQPLSSRIRTIIEACKRLKVDGVIDRYHVGCRIGVGDALIIKDAITEQLGIPILLLEWESFDPRVMDEEQYRKQLETFKDVLSNNRRQ